LLCGVGRVLLLQMVSAWKESGKLKDLKIEELNFQLGQAAAQLEVAKQEAAVLQQQLADTSTKVGAARHSVCFNNGMAAVLSWWSASHTQRRLSRKLSPRCIHISFSSCSSSTTPWCFLSAAAHQLLTLVLLFSSC
jgi:hypothetical protein